MTVPVKTGEPPSKVSFDMTDRGRLIVQDRNAGTRVPTTLADGTAASGAGSAVVISLGANGLNGLSTEIDLATGLNKILAAPTGADELENTDGDNVFVTRIRTGGRTGCDDTNAVLALCEFDDLVIMIPTPLLLGKMVQAGQLP